MATLAESLISSSSRPVKLRMRPDLHSRRHRYHGRTYWVVKEPVGLNYFRFHEEEYAILCMLDGQTSLDEIKEEFERQYTPQKITLPDLQQFVGMLHRSGLVISEATGQGRQLKRRRDQKARREWMGKFTNVFSLRFRGFDPEWILTKIYPWFGWLFNPITMLLALTFALSAVFLVAVQFDVFQARLPTFHQFFGVKNWFWLMLVMGTVKVLHEFGHGLSCKHYGGECHEIGMMLLVFTPCLYCNVSDSWMLPNKWHRAFIGAAGMYVELILASIATYLWWFSDSTTWLNQMSLSVMFICSVSTILFNGNPLLRYDGYYILMDIAEIPNLRQKSTEVLKRFMLEKCLGIEQQENPFLPQRNRFLFGLYTIASVVYRWIVVFSIMFFLNKVFEPYGLKIIGQAIAVAGMIGLVVQPLWQLAKFFYSPGRMSKVKRHRVIATAATVCGLVAAILWLPLPFNVRCTVEIQPRGAQALYAVSPGKLTHVSVKVGDHVTKGTPIAKLESIDLELAVATYEGQAAELVLQQATLEKLMHQNPRGGQEINGVKKQLAAVNEQLAEKRQELAEMELVAARDGTILPPPPKPNRPSPDGRLPIWSGSPFDPKNRGAFLAEGDVICRIGDPEEMEAVLIVDQADVDLVQTSNPVRIKLEAFPFETFRSTIQQIAQRQMEVTPAALSTQSGGELETKADESGVQRPVSTSYQARAPLDDPAGALRIGMRGQAKVAVGWKPIGFRIYRYIARTFHFHL